MPHSNQVKPVACLLVLFACSWITFASAAPLRILPIGDSITQGRKGSEKSQPTLSYRYPLWKRFVDAGIEVDFIGSLSGGFEGDPQWENYQGRSFDGNHEGHWGWTPAQVREKLEAWMAGYPPPDVVLLLLGTNGAGEANAIPVTVAAHREMIRLIRARNPKAVVLLGLPFQEWDPFPAMSLAYIRLAAELTTAVSPVLTVDHSFDWISNPDSDGSHTVDWVHPNPAGDRKIADNWFRALRPWLNQESERILPTAVEVVGRIQNHVNCDWAKQTVDTFKAGEVQTPVTGVAVTFMATSEVLRQAVRAGCNLIITHEPTFYHGQDEVTRLRGDAVLAGKREFIDQQGLIIWRFHDHIHRHQPDGIVEGMVDALGLSQQQHPENPLYFTVKETTVDALAKILQHRLGATSFRIIGDPGMKATRVGLSVGAPASIAQIQMLQQDAVEILLAGETREWETVPYVQDAVTQGRQKALILLGHVSSEELGMNWCAEWLREVVSEVPVLFLPAGEPYRTP